MTRQLLALAMLAAILMLAAACGGNGSNLPRNLDEPDVTLPWLGDLPAPDPSARRRVSEVNYELLLVAPVLTSGGGSVEHESGHVTLKPALNGDLAWALYALPGFPSEGTVYPTGITVDKNLPPMWVGLSDYGRGAWQYLRFANSGGVPIENGNGLYSPGGVLYVALIATQGQLEFNSVIITTNVDLPGAPIAVINLPAKVVVGYAATFTATGSDPGGGDWVSLTYTFDGADEQTVTDPDEEVTHTFTTEGLHSVELSVENTLARVDYTEEDVNVELPLRELLVVYNSNVTASEDLAQYYASPETGRGIDPDYIIGLELGDNEKDINRAGYLDNISTPLKAHLDASGYKDTIKYIVLMKGVPYDITDDGGDSVDSELCMLYENGSYTASGKLFSGTTYASDTLPQHAYAYDNTGFFEGLDGEERSFTPFFYQVSDSGNNRYFLSYLVGRISAYTYDEAKLIIDRALTADTSGSGWVIMDTHPGWNSSETMTDPVFPFQYLTPPEDMDSLDEILANTGFNKYLDNEYTVLLEADLSEEACQNIIGFCGWGVNHSRYGGDQYPGGKMYILEYLGFLTYLPGAAWIVYESFAAQRFDWDGETGTHASQGQICDFFHMGGTVAVGNCNEPLTTGVPDERRVMERYVIKGDRWIEAAYKGIRYLSWHTIVAGDPLCRVVAE